MTISVQAPSLAAQQRRCSVASKAQLALTFALTVCASQAWAQTSYAKGPAPSLASIQAVGPFAVSSQKITGSGYNGGTVYSPNAAGTYALIAVATGFFAYQSSVAQISERLATHGFVVVTFDSNTIFDSPESRGTQLLAVLKSAAALTTGPAAGKIDASRQGVAGWSNGGGGALVAASSTPGLKGAVSFAPRVSNSNNLPRITVPTAILVGDADTTNPPAQYSVPYYALIPTSTQKLLGIISGATHQFPTTASQPASYTEIAWMKRFLDNDTRYSQFLRGDSRLSSFSSTGPF